MHLCEGTRNIPLHDTRVCFQIGEHNDDHSYTDTRHSRWEAWNGAIKKIVWGWLIGLFCLSFTPFTTPCKDTYNAQKLKKNIAPSYSGAGLRPLQECRPIAHYTPHRIILVNKVSYIENGHTEILSACVTLWTWTMRCLIGCTKKHTKKYTFWYVFLFA